VLGLKSATFGLDIGFNTLKVVEVKGTGKGAHLVGAAELPIPENSLNKNGIQKRNELSQVIRQATLVAKPHRIGANIAVCGLPESLVFTKTLDLPKMNDAEIAKNIPFQAKDFLPLPIEETYMDWQTVGILPDGKIEVLMVATPKVIVDAIIDTVKLAGFELLGLDTKPVALTRALVEEKDTNGYLILDIGAQTSSITCYDQGTVKLTSTIACGGDKVREEPTSALKVISNEVMHSVKYYQNRIGQTQVFRKIILAGGGANLPDVARIIEGLLKIRTEIGKPVADIKDYNPKFASALGLAMKEI